MAASDGQTKTSMMTMVVIILLLTLMGGGAGLAVGVLVLPTAGEVAEAVPSVADATTPPTPESHSTESATETSDPQTAPDDSEADSTSKEEEVALEQYKIVPLPPVITNLAKPSDKWIRIEGSILVRPGGDMAPEQIAERSGEQILAYLRTVSLDQLEGPSGLLALRDDLNETVHTLSSGEVHSVLIHGLIVE